MDGVECSKLIDSIIKTVLVCAGWGLLGSQLPLTTCRNPQCRLSQNRDLAWNICLPAVSVILPRLNYGMVEDMQYYLSFSHI